MAAQAGAVALVVALVLAMVALAVELVDLAAKVAMAAKVGSVLGLVAHWCNRRRQHILS